MSERKKTVILALCLLLIIEAGFCVWEYIIRPKANLCDNPYGITIHCKDEDLLQECLSEMDKLPPSLLERFKQEKWALFVGDGYRKDVRIQFNNGKIMGMTRTACKEILVSSPEEIAHEFGHFLYITLDAPNAFHVVYEKDASAANMPSYFTADDPEYFAESFAYYINRIDVFDGIEETKAYFENLQRNGWVLV